MGDCSILQTVEKQDRPAILPVGIRDVPLLNALERLQNDVMATADNPSPFPMPETSILTHNAVAEPVQSRPGVPGRIRQPALAPNRAPENPVPDKKSNGDDPAIPKIRVALVDDDQSIHMRQIFKNWASHWSLESFLDGNVALEKFRESPPHVVLMDISMPDVNGIECTRRVKSLMPHLPVIMFTARVDTESFILAMIAGASGYLIKPIPSFDIVAAIKKALEGMPALCVQTEKSVVQWLHGLGEGISGWGLTSREQQIILHLCSNRTDKEIAQHLGISPGTVHTHLVPLFKKMGVHTRDEAKRKFLGLKE
jgi:DNA-binding NarL/FixJ family response regulator